LTAGVLINSGDTLVFRHDLIRKVFAEQVPASTRSALHARAAQTLIALSAAVERIAYHLSATGADLTGVESASLVERARDLTPAAPELALSVLDRALHTPGIDPAHIEQLKLWHAAALLVNEQPEKAEAYLRTMRASTDSLGTHSWLLARACFEQ